jgi:hypothetical protein
MVNSLPSQTFLNITSRQEVFHNLVWQAKLAGRNLTESELNETRNTREYIISHIDSSINQKASKRQIIPELVGIPAVVTFGESCFSPDGKIFVSFDAHNRCKIFDFDRCTGELSNFRWINPLARGDTLYGSAGCAISPNSRYLYLFMRNIIGQYDLLAPDIEASAIKVAQNDGYVFLLSPPPPIYSYPHTFNQGQLGPDGKIYIFSFVGRPTFSVIEHPDSFGLACDVRQHMYEFGDWGNVTHPPRFPNYRLGPVLGSPCDTLTSAGAEPDIIRAQMQLRPNPATSHTVIDISLASYSSDMSIEIIVSDLSGMQVGQYQVPPYTSLQRVETGSFPNGMYLVTMRGKGVLIKTEKLVVLRE